MTTETMTLEQFIAANALAATVEPADSNPSMMADDDWNRTASHWCVTIGRAEPEDPGDLTVGTMTVPFSQGSGHTEPPTLADVLDCLASDAATIDNARSFDDWAQELGFFPMESSTDYQRAQSAYQTTTRQTDELRAILGDEAMATLMYGVERL